MEVIWTAELVDRLRQLHSTGLSFSNIAKRLNAEHNLKLTSNAVIGKARRSDLPPRLESAWKATRPPPDAPAKPRRPNTPPRPVARLGPPGGELRAIDLGPPVSKGLTIMQLTSQVCHWPHGARPPYTYCGAPAHLETAFCRHHYDLVYVKPAKRWN
jgi:hypothetical protein